MQNIITPLMFTGVVFDVRCIVRKGYADLRYGITLKHIVQGNFQLPSSLRVLVLTSGRSPVHMALQPFNRGGGYNLRQKVRSVRAFDRLENVIR
jgi:hypothetical protein